nr:hypothetical protein StreXyl84_30850 [Streptomyces sp. Xyl84]
MAAEAVDGPPGAARGPVPELGGGDDHPPGQVRLPGTGREAVVQIEEGEAGRVRAVDQVAVAEERLVAPELQGALGLPVVDAGALEGVPDGVAAPARVPALTAAGCEGFRRVPPSRLRP